MKRESLKSIVIDDNRNDFEILSRLLRRYYEKIEVDHAENGRDALNKLRERYDVVFLDLNMPDINGLELLELIVKGGNDTPVIMVTGHGDQKAAVSAMKAGAYDYIIKDDLNAELLAKTVSHTLERKRLKQEKEFLEKGLLFYTDRLEEMVRERTAEIEYLNNYKELILSTLNQYIRVVDPRENIIQYESLKLKNSFGDNAGKPCFSFWGKGEKCKDCISLKAIEDGIIKEKEEDCGDKKYLVSAIPLKNRDGSVSAIEVITDITEKKRMEAEIDKSKRFAAMGEIAAIMAHEIRNPLQKIKMGTELLSENKKLTEQEEMISKAIKGGINELYEFVNNILDFSRPQRPIWENTDIKHLLGNILEEKTSVTRDKGIEITKQFPEEEIISWIDALRLKSVFKNVINNSIQAVEEGSGRIIVSLSLIDAGNTIEVKISDNGHGIREDDLKRIFEPFFTTKAKGTGLGMCIVKKFVDMHDGEIEIKSKEGEGTEVVMTFPVKTERPPARDYWPDLHEKNRMV